MTRKTLVLLLSFNVFSTLGQLLFKAGMQHVPNPGPLELLRCVFTPLVMLGLVCYAMGMLVWLALVQKHALSLVYPFISISYILVVLVAEWYFGESVSWVTWGGVGLICLGVVCVGLGGSQKPAPGL